MPEIPHSLIDVAPQPKADSSAFDFSLPMHVFEKADAPEGQKRRFGGICSTDNIDRQGERILQDGLDWGDFFEHGWFNDNHSQKTADVLGYGDKNSLVQFKSGDLLPNGNLATCNGTWVEGYLLNRPACDQIWDLAQSLQGTGRTLGFSVEGNILKRSGAGNKTIAKAKIRNVALTACPVNQDAKLEILARSLIAVEDQARRDEASKAMGGAGAPVPLANASGTGMTAGRIVAKEALEPGIHNNAGGEILRRKRKKKTLTRSQAVAYVQGRVPGLAYNEAEEIVMRSEEFSKAGEGSRGGHVIGHTKSGKAIYGTGHARYASVASGESDSWGLQAHKHTPHYTQQDHEDAAIAHLTAAKHASSQDVSDKHEHIAAAHDFTATLMHDKANGVKNLKHRSQKRKSLSHSQAISYVRSRAPGISKSDVIRVLKLTRIFN